MKILDSLLFLCACVVLGGAMPVESADYPPVSADLSRHAFAITGDRQDEGGAVSALFDDVQSGIVAGDVKKFSMHLARQVFINLRGMESGYFSRNQAFYILDSYLSARRVVSFTFSTMNDSEPVPYATGGGIFMRRGKREIFQVYTSLSKQDGQWVVTQLNVY